MKAKYKYLPLLVFVAMLVYACREKFNPPAISVTSNFLVVEGFINTGADSTFIKLSRTTKLTDATITKVEPKAIVTIESSAGATYNLTELSPGTYAAGPLGLNTTLKYRVRIKTSANKSYLSDYVAAYVAPPIDSLYWRPDDKNITFYSNAHDVAGNTRYYRYTYDETFEYNAAIYSALEVDGKTIRDRSTPIFTCWKTVTSPNIIIASSAKLTQNQIFENPVLQTTYIQQKFFVKYSLNLKQYAISEEAYTFWQNLKKNTEQLGSIFDAQPSQLQGNVHGVTDVAEPVFGYIGAGTVQQKRIFIAKADLPSFRIIDDGRCVEDTLLFYNPKTLINEVSEFLYSNLKIPVVDIPGGYLGTTISCADCRTQGGKNKRPAFWK